MEILKHKQAPLIIGFTTTAIIVVILAFYFISTLNSLSDRITLLSTKITSVETALTATAAKFDKSDATTRATLATVLSTEQQSVGTIQQQLGGFQSQVGSLTGTLTTLQKLSQTDPELLKKYSKVFFLNENYVPTKLAEIPADYEYSTNPQLLIETDVLPHLKGMIQDATSAGIPLYAFSAYRSFADQRALKDNYRVTFGAGTANSFSADQGYSEHQLGTAVDMITKGQGGVIDGFDKTPAYQWMLANAYKYGFTLSYPQNNSYYVFEPWHWRYVGVQLATDLHNQGKNFYDLDQRTIDSYLVHIFD